MLILCKAEPEALKAARVGLRSTAAGQRFALLLCAGLPAELRSCSAGLLGGQRGRVRCWVPVTHAQLGPVGLAASSAQAADGDLNFVLCLPWR